MTRLLDKGVTAHANELQFQISRSIETNIFSPCQASHVGNVTKSPVGIPTHEESARLMFGDDT